MPNQKTKRQKLIMLPKSETDYVWVPPRIELAKKGDYIPGEGVIVKGNKIYSDGFGFVNIDKKKVIRVVPLVGG